MLLQPSTRSTPRNAASTALRRWYWDWRRYAARRRRATLANSQLARLRRLARSVPPRQAGVVQLANHRVRYDDALSLYMEFKHIFAWGIYDFQPRGRTPRVLDCGGHIGLSVLRAKQLAPGARITVFEPDPRVLPLLRANLEQNRLADVEVVAAALSTGAGESSFLGDGADGGALVDPGMPGAAPVATVALSAYLRQPVDYLKMNIEGAELGVLREAAKYLHNVRQLAVEYHGFPHTGQVLHEILALLDETGFRYAIHHFDAETNPALKPPFRFNETTRFFQLITATRVWDRRASRSRPDQTPPLPQSAGDAAPPAPLSRVFGHDRGHPIDRHYVETFLFENAPRIRDRVLEVGEDSYTRRFGGAAVTRSDVLNVVPNPRATIVADLTDCPRIADAAYDCVILTQTLPFIFDLSRAIANCRRILRPGGALLVTVPGISQRSAYDAERWGDYWRFTPQSLEMLLRREFINVSLTCFGNVRSATALLEGRAARELTPIELDHRDPDYPVIIAAIATQAAALEPPR